MGGYTPFMAVLAGQVQADTRRSWRCWRARPGQIHAVHGGAGRLGLGGYMPFMVVLAGQVWVDTCRSSPGCIHTIDGVPVLAGQAWVDTNCQDQ